MKYDENLGVTTRNTGPYNEPVRPIDNTSIAYESVLKLVEERKSLIKKVTAIDRHLNDIRKVLSE